MKNRSSRTKDIYSPFVIIIALLLFLGGIITAVSQAKSDESTLTLSLQNVFPSLTFGGPVDIANAGDNRLFIVEQRGNIRVVSLEPGAVDSEFLEVPHPITGGGEGGLLGLVFHPDYQSNGYFYVNYTLQTSGKLYTYVSRFQVTGDPNVADPNSELVILRVEQPYPNHNAGDLAFGDDGYLYVPLGDGGDGGDPHNNGQTPSTLLGSILRLDVDGGGLAPECGQGPTNYTIPPDNPFVADNDNKCNEIWATGLRNPWRFSFDRQTQDLYIGDVGQGTWEEIDYQPAGTGGLNYGWRCYEGNSAYNTSGCNPNTSVYTFPVAVYESNGGPCAVSGGFVYRGSRYSNLQGHYFYGDYCSGQLWSLETDPPGVFTNSLQLDTTYSISTFGEDVYGEVYLADRSAGRIYRLQGAGDPNYLSLQKKAPKTAVSGELITYTITALNSGNLTLTNVSITDTLPAGATYVSGGSLSGNIVSWPAFSLAPYSQKSVQFVVTAANSITNFNYGATADAGYKATGYPVTTLIGTAPDYLSIKKKAPVTAAAGEPITYTLTVQNHGGIALTNVTITDRLPTGATYVSGGNLAGNIVSWPPFDLGPGSSVSKQFVVTATDTIINTDYGATAAGGYKTSGVPVATLIGDIRQIYLPAILKP